MLKNVNNLMVQAAGLGVKGAGKAIKLTGGAVTLRTTCLAIGYLAVAKVVEEISEKN